MTYVSRHGDVEAKEKFRGSRPVKVPHAIGVNHLSVSVPHLAATRHNVACVA